MIDVIQNSIHDAFVAKHPFSHHMKTTAWATCNHEKFECLGYYENDELKASALVIQKTIVFGLFRYAYIPWGFCVDYTDMHLLEQSTKAFIQYLRRRYFFFRIDPNVERLQHEANGDIVADGFNNEHIKDQLVDLGFKHLGYCYGYSGNWQPRFTFLVDIDKSEEDIIQQYSKETKTYLKKNEMRHIVVEKGQIDDLKYLEEFGILLSEKMGFKPKTQKEYQEILDAYKDNAHFYIAKSDLKKAVETLNIEIATMKEQAMELMENARNKGKVKELHSEIENLENEIVQIEAIQTDKIVLGAGLFVTCGDKSWDLYLYNTKFLTNFRSPISIHAHAMKQLKARGVKVYDMVGISGSVDKKDPYYGLYDFKKRFGGRFVEYLGEFDYVVSKGLYLYFQKSDALKRRIYRKIQRTFRRKST